MMTKRDSEYPITTILIIVCAFAFLPVIAFAQGGGKATAGEGSKRESVKIRKFTGIGAQCLVKTPEYRSSMRGSVKQPSDWAQITVTYDTGDEWIDDLTLQFYVMTKDKKGNYSLYKNAARHVDVQEGKGHMTAMYLRPTALKRYGQIIAVAVEVAEGGKIIDERSEGGVGDKKEWWKNPAVTESKKVTVREGYLLDRSQSPFALVNIDDYEVSK